MEIEKAVEEKKSDKNTYKRITNGYVVVSMRCHTWLAQSAFHWNQYYKIVIIVMSRRRRQNHRGKINYHLLFEVNVCACLSCVVAHHMTTTKKQQNQTNISWWHCHFCHGQNFISSFHWWCTHTWSGGACAKMFGTRSCGWVHINTHSKYSSLPPHMQHTVHRAKPMSL